MSLNHDICRCVSDICVNHSKCARFLDVPQFYTRLSFADLLEDGTTGESCESFIPVDTK